LGNNRTVLVIDDDAHIRRVIELKLRKRGYEVITAMNGQEGLDLIKSQLPDVVITDIMMPKLDGETLCRQTDHFKRQHPFLTIVVTSRISPDDHRWVEEMNNTQLMEKPFSLSRMLARIDQYCSSGR
jgi:DNA-binding response OmpR family regulator